MRSWYSIVGFYGVVSGALTGVAYAAANYAPALPDWMIW